MEQNKNEQNFQLYYFNERSILECKTAFLVQIILEQVLSYL